MENLNVKVEPIEKVNHPGEKLKERLKEMNMGIKEFAVRICRAEKTILDIVKGNSSITADMAVSFEHVTKKPAQYWLQHQRLYDEYLVRIKNLKETSSSIEWMENFPFEDMVNLGWIPQASSDEEKIQILLEYFCVSTPKAWQNYYINQRLRIIFRSSLSETKNPHAVSAWLRRGEILSRQMSISSSYNLMKLKSKLVSMLKIKNEKSPDYLQKLQNLCLSVGINLISVPYLPKAEVICATRWISGVPVIQLAQGRMDYEQFWLTFFHGIAHIFLHGKKDLFLEGENKSAPKQTFSRDKESDANKLTARILMLMDQKRKPQRKKI